VSGDWHALLLGPVAWGAAEWLALVGHFLMLSLLAVGGAITTAPEMQRFVVGERGWLTDGQFAESVALAQAAPGPNVLFVAVIGFNVAGLPGAIATLVPTLLPSTLLTLRATRWGASRRDTLPVRAFSAGLAPVTIGLLLATAWILFEPASGNWGNAVLIGATMAVALRTRLNPLWSIAAGALAGALGWAG
jgi:chromate transporter